MFTKAQINTRIIKMLLGYPNQQIAHLYKRAEVVVVDMVDAVENSKDTVTEIGIKNALKHADITNVVGAPRVNIAGVVSVDITSIVGIDVVDITSIVNADVVDIVREHYVVVVL